MNSTVKKVLVLAGSSAAVAGGSFATYVLTKRAPKRQAFRDATGWRPTVPPRCPPRPAAASNTEHSIRPAGPRSTAPKAPGEIAKSDPERPKPKPGLIGAVKEVFTEFSGDDVMTQAAGLAFYAGLAFAPMMTLTVWIVRVSTGDASKDKVADIFGRVLGPATAEPMKQLLSDSGNKGESGMAAAGIISIFLVIFSASGVFGQVQSALNAVWHVEPKPSSGIMGFVRKRLLSVGMLASITFLLMTSLIVSTVLAGFINAFGGSLGAIVLAVVEPIVSLIVFTVLFAAMFRFVPDAKIEWKPVWIGAVISAVLFTIGKYGLAIYLGHSDYNSSYGAAAGSFVALLTWVYYSSIIMLLGAEATEVTARRLGHGLQPDEHAVRVVKTTEPAGT